MLLTQYLLRSVGRRRSCKTLSGDRFHFPSLLCYKFSLNIFNAYTSYFTLKPFAFLLKSFLNSKSMGKQQRIPIRCAVRTDLFWEFTVRREEGEKSLNRNSPETEGWTCFPGCEALCLMVSEEQRPFTEHPAHAWCSAGGFT